MEKNRPPANAVCDAGPIIHLDELGSLNLLESFHLLVPQAVWQEVQSHRPSAVKWLKDHCQEHAGTDPLPTNLLALANVFSLDKGEMEALSIMCHIPGAIFLTDDAAARLAAQQLGYRVHGSIGILIRAVRCNQLDAQEVIDRLRSIPNQSTLFVRDSLLEEIIARVQQEFGLAH